MGRFSLEGQSIGSDSSGRSVRTFTTSHPTKGPHFRVLTLAPPHVSFLRTVSLSFPFLYL